MISNNYYYAASTIRSALDWAIRNVSENITLYSHNPGFDFTRNRKMVAKNLMYYLISLSDRSINSDMVICHFANLPIGSHRKWQILASEKEKSAKGRLLLAKSVKNIF